MRLSVPDLGPDLDVTATTAQGEVRTLIVGRALWEGPATVRGIQGTIPVAGTAFPIASRPPPEQRPGRALRVRVGAAVVPGQGVQPFGGDAGRPRTGRAGGAGAHHLVSRGGAAQPGLLRCPHRLVRRWGVRMSVTGRRPEDGLVRPLAAAPSNQASPPYTPCCTVAASPAGAGRGRGGGTA